MAEKKTPLVEKRVNGGFGRMQNRFTKKARKVLNDAQEIAKELGHNYVGTEHLLVALIRDSGVASEVLRANGVEEQKILDLIDETISTVLLRGHRKLCQRPRKRQIDWEYQRPEQSIF